MSEAGVFVTGTRDAAIPFAHPVYVRSILDYLNSMGIRPETVLANSGLNWKDLSDGQPMVDFSVFRRFVANAVKCSGDPALGLTVGSMLQPYHTPVGIGAVTSGTLGEGLQYLCRHAKLIFGSLLFQLETGSRWGTLRIKPLRPLCETHVFVTQSILGSICKLLEAILGRPVDELIVGLPYARAECNDIACFRHGRRAEFDQMHLSFHLPVELLRHSSAAADPKALLNAEQVCRRMESELGSGGFVQRVRRVMLEELPSNPDVGQLASDLGITARTLVRRLADVGVTYSDIKADLRKAHAAWYLQNTDLSMEAIASQLGYADATNFSRSFKNWYSVAPSKMRRNLRIDSPTGARST